MCGIAALNINGPKHGKGQMVGLLYKMLLQEQNRGQLSAGISTYDSCRVQLIDTFKGLGSVNEVFKLSHQAEREGLVKKYSGSKGIGHVRYATCGIETDDYAQPFERQHGRKWKWFSFGFNGQITNFFELKKELAKDNYHLIRDTDTELIMHFIAKQFIGTKRMDLLEWKLSNSRGRKAFAQSS